MSAPALDPYALLGVGFDSSPTEIRRAYLDLAMIVHPDKGGCSAQMSVLRSAYEFVSEHAKTVARHSDCSVESLEREFAAFCAAQLESSSSHSHTGFDASRFNAEFEAHVATCEPCDLMLAADPEGYGASMDASEQRHGTETETETETKTSVVVARQPLCRDMSVIRYQDPAPAMALVPRDYTSMLVLDYSRSDHSRADSDFGAPPFAYDYRAAYNETPERIEMPDDGDLPPVPDPAVVAESRMRDIDTLFSMIVKPSDRVATPNGTLEMQQRCLTKSLRYS
jgi:hypothetical protein